VHFEAARHASRALQSAPREDDAISPIALVLSTLLVAPALYLSAVCGYLLVISIGAWLYRPQRGGPEKPPRIALLIPAHNEREHIASVIHAATHLDYPEDRHAVCVIADNCTDETAAIARAGGAVVFERHDPIHRGKGQALDWCLREQQDTLSAFDVIAIVDADMFIDQAFLRELAATFADPRVEVVQGLNTVAHPERSWRTALGYLGFSVINHVRPAGRCWLGGTAELKGSGMAFRARLLLQYGWPAHSLAEDAEFGKRLLLDGVRVHYNPRAIVTSDIPTTTAQARIQQRRWEGGKVQLLKQYLPILARNAVRRPTPGNIDALLDILVPPQTLLFFLIAAALGVSLFADPVFIYLFAACAACVAFCVFSGLALTRAPLKVWLSLLAVPVLLAWKIPVYANLLLRRGAHAWQRTPRDEEHRNRRDD